MKKILITGVTGFVGNVLAHELIESNSGIKIFGIDNLSRPGVEMNISALRKKGVDFFRGDIRNASDFETIPIVDFVIDCAANPSVLAGVDGKSSSRQVVEHNLCGTINMLEYCKRAQAGFILMSTSRVYSAEKLSSLLVSRNGDRFELGDSIELLNGLSINGVNESFSTQPPLSVYGTTKMASELLALEYGSTFDFPVWINRCGVLAGSGQFGHAEQGIFSYWLHSWRAKRPLKYIGFDGQGLQVRDCLHPKDLVPVILQQIEGPTGKEKICNFSGGKENSMSLRELSSWCENRWGIQPVEGIGVNRRFDVPWLILDSRKAHDEWKWRPKIKIEEILEEIGEFSEVNPEWLNICL